MRVGEKSAEAVVAEKAGNAAGAKGRRTKNGARERIGWGKETRFGGSCNYGSRPRECQRQKRCSRSELKTTDS